MNGGERGVAQSGVPAEGVAGVETQELEADDLLLDFGGEVGGGQRDGQGDAEDGVVRRRTDGRALGEGVVAGDRGRAAEEAREEMSIARRRGGREETRAEVPGGVAGHCDLRGDVHEEHFRHRFIYL